MQPSAPELKIEYYQTNVGVFFKIAKTTYYTSGLKQFADFVDGVEVEYIPLINGYYKVDKVPENVIKNIPGKSEIVSYKLKFPEMQCDKIPSSIDASHVEWGFYTDDEGDEVHGVVGTYQHIIQFYEAVLQKTTDSLQAVNVVATKLGDLVVDNWQQPEKMTVQMKPDSNYGKTQFAGVDVATIVNYDDFDRLFTPEFMIHVRPCKLTSKQVFSIVRAYIIENINPKKATITSNYDFCFTVKKKIKTEPFISRVVKSLGNSRRATTYKNLTMEEREVQIFEMTYAGYDGKASGYAGYTAIKEWEANSLKEMQKKIKEYLENLIEVINSDVEECKHCSGNGVCVKEVATNTRKF